MLFIATILQTVLLISDERCCFSPLKVGAELYEIYVVWDSVLTATLN